MIYCNKIILVYCICLDVVKRPRLTFRVICCSAYTTQIFSLLHFILNVTVFRFPLINSVVHHSSALGNKHGGAVVCFPVTGQVGSIEELKV